VDDEERHAARAPDHGLLERGLERADGLGELGGLLVGERTHREVPHAGADAAAGPGEERAEGGRCIGLVARGGDHEEARRRSVISPLNKELKEF
jgi:hypothetical protein